MLVGYDPMKTRSKRIPIVSAYIKVRAHNQIPIILKINEAPYYENNPITLLSEYQIQEHGYLIDSVATKHLKSENEYGTQQLTLSRLLHVPFEDRGGIMGFEILPITDQDMHNGEPIYDVFEITSSQIWKPARYRTEQKTHVAKLSAEPCRQLTYFDPSDEALEEPNMINVAKIEPDWEAIALMDESKFTQYQEHDDDIVNTFLAQLTFEELTAKEPTMPEYIGYPKLDEPDANAHFDSYAYATASWHRVIHDQLDPAQVAPYLGYRPLDVVRETIRTTTQLAKMIIRYPMRRHFKSRAPFLNVNRLDEAVSTDPMYANCASLHHRFIGAQVFYGLKSHHIDVYGFKKPRNFPQMYQDFIREQGAPSLLRRDNAQEEQSEEVKNIHRELYIKDGYSEPYQPNQNPVESKAIKWLKQASHVLLDRRGAPDGAWYFAVKYLADVHSICYHKKIDMSPRQKRTGVTPDISAYLQFRFWARVLYLDHEEKWPSSNE